MFCLLVSAYSPFSINHSRYLTGKKLYQFGLKLILAVKIWLTNTSLSFVFVSAHHTPQPFPIARSLTVLLLAHSELFESVFDHSELVVAVIILCPSCWCYVVCLCSFLNFLVTCSHSIHCVTIRQTFGFCRISRVTTCEHVRLFCSWYNIFKLAGEKTIDFCIFCAQFFMDYLQTMHIAMTVCSAICEYSVHTWL